MTLITEMFLRLLERAEFKKLVENYAISQKVSEDICRYSGTIINSPESSMESINKAVKVCEESQRKRTLAHDAVLAAAGIKRDESREFNNALAEYCERRRHEIY